MLRAVGVVDQRQQRVAQGRRRREVVDHPTSRGRVFGLLVREGVGGALQHTAGLLVRGPRVVLALGPLANLVVDRSNRYGKHVAVIARCDSLRIRAHALRLAHDQGVGRVDPQPVEPEPGQHRASHPFVVQRLAQPHNRPSPVGLHHVRQALGPLERTAFGPLALAVQQPRECLGPRRPRWTPKSGH